MKSEKENRIMCVYLIVILCVGLAVGLTLNSKKDAYNPTVRERGRFVGIEYYNTDGLLTAKQVDYTKEGLSSLDRYVLSGISIRCIHGLSSPESDGFIAVSKGSDSDTFYISGYVPDGTTVDNKQYTIKREELSKDIELLVKASEQVYRGQELPININTSYKVRVAKSSDGIFKGLICDPVYTEEEILLNDFNGQKVDAGQVWKLLGHLDSTKKDLAVLIHTTTMNPKLYWVYHRAIDGSISLGKTEDANSLELVQVSLSQEQGQTRFEGELSREIGGMETILTEYKTNDLDISKTSYDAEYIYSRKTGEVIGIVLTAR